jgi:hypothetical protein
VTTGGLVPVARGVPPRVMALVLGCPHEVAAVRLDLVAAITNENVPTPSSGDRATVAIESAKAPMPE